MFVRTAISLLLLAALPAWLEGQLVEIRVRESTVVVNSPTVLVSDVAEVKSPSNQLARQIAALDIDSFRDGQSALTVSTEQIAWRIRLAGHPPASLSITGPATATVRLADPSGAAAELGQWLAAELAKGLGLEARTLNVNPQLDQHFARLIPLWEQQRGAAWQLRLPASLPAGPFAFGLEMVAADGQRRSAILVATVSQLPAAVPGREATPSSADPGFAINDHQIQLASATTSAPTGQPAASIQRLPPVVRAGGRVAVTLNQGPLSIRIVNARALSAGAVGDLITVENSTTRRQMPARVLDSQTVELVR